MADSKLMVFSGNANKPLAEAVAKHLGMRLGKIEATTFSDGEISIEILENVRGKDVFVIQPTCAPTNQNLMELILMVDAFKRSSSYRITTVIPYLGYSRQDRRLRSARSPISAKVVANLITTAGADRVLTIDLHAEQIQGFFDAPADNIYASPVLLADMWKQRTDNMIVVSPDVGGVVRARALAKQLDDSDLAIIDKRRPKANESKVMNLIGDVSGKSCIMIDDIVDTAGTLCHAADALKEKGAERVIAYCTHAVLSGKALENIENSELDELVVTDTIPLPERLVNCPKIRQLSISSLLAETIRRIHFEESVSTIYME